MRKRNYGIDLLRIVAMLMICVLHILLKSGSLDNAQNHKHYLVAWIMEIVCYCAVDCYALISGYVGVKAKHRWRNIVYLWVQVVFYSIILQFVVHYFVPACPLSKSMMLFPLLYNRYWYFTAYFGLFFVIPLLNYILKNFSKQQMLLVVIGIICIASVGVGVLAREKDIWGLHDGYSFLWLVCLYLIGGYISLYGWHWPYRLSNGVIYFGGLLVTILVFAFYHHNPKLLVSYLSPTILAISLALLVIFVKLPIEPKTIASKTIEFFAPLTFGVYLIHTHPAVFEYLLPRLLPHLYDHSNLLFVAGVLLCALGIFAFCSLIDYVRLRIFKYLRVPYLSQKFVEQISGTLKKY